MNTIALRTNAITAKVCEEMHLECTDYFQSKVNFGTNYCLTIVYCIFNVSYIFFQNKNHAPCPRYKRCWRWRLFATESSLLAKPFLARLLCIRSFLKYFYKVYLYTPGGSKSACQAWQGGGRRGQRGAQDHHEPQGDDHQPDVRPLWRAQWVERWHPGHHLQVLRGKIEQSCATIFLCRNFSNMSPKEWKWLIFDGPVSSALDI